MIEYSITDCIKTLKTHNFNGRHFSSRAEILDFFFTNWAYWLRKNTTFSENILPVKYYKNLKQRDLKVQNRCLLTSLKSCYPKIFKDEWFNLPLDLISHAEKLLSTIQSPYFNRVSGTETVKYNLIDQLKKQRPCTLCYDMYGYGHAIACIGLSETCFYFIENADAEVTYKLLTLGLFLDIYNRKEAYPPKVIRAFLSIKNYNDKNEVIDTLIKYIKVEQDHLTGISIENFFNFSFHHELIYLKDIYDLTKTGDIVLNSEKYQFDENLSSLWSSLIKEINFSVEKFKSGGK